MGNIPSGRHMEDFCETYTDLAENGYDEHGRQYIHIEKPVALPVFAAFCSGNDQEVFLRGCTQNFEKSLPSLFRDTSRNVNAHWRDYECLLRELKASQAIKGLGWNRPNLGAVLQHYGIKTPWLDVVRNLYTAIWFATHDLKQSPCERHESIEDDCRGCGSRRFAKPSCQKYGWISFYMKDSLCSIEDPCLSRKLIVQDIPCKQSSKHFRPHAQQGVSLAMQCDPEEQQSESVPEQNQDFNRWKSLSADSRPAP